MKFLDLFEKALIVLEFINTLYQELYVILFKNLYVYFIIL